MVNFAVSIYSKHVSKVDAKICAMLVESCGFMHLRDAIIPLKSSHSCGAITYNPFNLSQTNPGFYVSSVQVI